MKIQVRGKINLKSFIYSEKTNKTVEKDGIKVTVLTKEVYKDNEKYEIKVENTTNKTILIDTRQSSNTLFLLGDNAIKYNSNIAEIATIMQRIPSSITRTYRIRFYKTYSSGVEGAAVVFSDIVPDYDQYIKGGTEALKRVLISIPIIK